jgi:CheY-like chemotaxis protein
MRKILIVDDDPLIRESLLEMLGFEDYLGLEADNGQTGLQLAQAELPDLIISDVMMAKLDGFGMLKRLRQQRETATIPIIFLTARVERHIVEEIEAMGVSYYLTKPFTMETLLSAIQDVLA